jgi:hypothetical protein
MTSSSLRCNVLGVAVLSILDKKYVKKSGNDRARVNEQLPGIREVKQGPGHGPRKDYSNRNKKCDRRAEKVSHDAGQMAETEPHGSHHG